MVGRNLTYCCNFPFRGIGYEFELDNRWRSRIAFIDVMTSLKNLDMQERFQSCFRSMNEQKLQPFVTEIEF